MLSIHFIFDVSAVTLISVIGGNNIAEKISSTRAIASFGYPVVWGFMIIPAELSSINDQSNKFIRFNIATANSNDLHYYQYDRYLVRTCNKVEIERCRRSFGWTSYPVLWGEGS